MKRHFTILIVTMANVVLMATVTFQHHVIQELGRQIKQMNQPVNVGIILELRHDTNSAPLPARQEGYVPSKDL